MPVPVSSAAPRPVVAEPPAALRRDAPEPPSLLEQGAGHVADVVKLGAKATLHLGVGPIFAKHIEDLGTQLVEPEARTARRDGLARQLEQRVRVRVHHRLDALQGQIDGQRVALLGPDRGPALQALRGPIARGVKIRAELDAVERQLVSRGAATTAAVMAAVEVASFVASVGGLDPATGSIADLMARRDALQADLKVLVQRHPALGALDLSQVSAELPDPDLQVRLREGFSKAEQVLIDLRARIDDGDIPLMNLGPMVQAALQDLGISAARAAQGHEDSALLLQHLEFERNAEMSEDMLVMGVSFALSAAAVLVTGPLAGFALAAAGVAFDGAFAWQAFEQAEDLEEVATAGLEGDAGIADVEAASHQYNLAIVGGALTAISGGAALKHAAGLGKLSVIGRARPRPTDAPKAAIVVEDLGEALPPPGRRPVTPDEPTWVGLAARADDDVARTRPVTPDEPTWVGVAARVDDGAARRAAVPASEAPTAPSRPATSNELPETGPTLLDPTLTQVRAPRAEDVIISPPVRTPVTARIRPGTYAPSARGVAPRPDAPPTAYVRTRGAEPAPSAARPTPRAQAAGAPEAPRMQPGERFLNDALGPLREMEQMQRALRELPPVPLAHAVAKHDPKVLQDLIVLVDARTFLRIAERFDGPDIIRLLNDPEQLALLTDGPIALLDERLMRWVRAKPRPAPIDEKVLEPAAPEPPPASPPPAAAPAPRPKLEVGEPVKIGELLRWKMA